MIAAPLPANETQRLAALRSLNLLDTAPEKEFDDLTRLASQICGTPIALVSLIDAERQWFKSRVGITATETPRNVSFCAHAILGSDLFEVVDAREDARFNDHPLVVQGQLRFYAGVPLAMQDGYNLGTLCVIDSKPRRLSPEQAEALRIIARQVVRQLELRVLNQNLERLVTERTAALHQTEERFRQLAEESSEVFWITDLNPERTVYVSPAAEKVWGLSPQCFYETQRTWASLAHPDDQNRVRAAWEACLRGETRVFEADYRVLRHDGSVRWVLDSGTPIRNESGEIIRVSGIARDITERKLAEERLRLSEYSVNCSSVATLWVAPDARILRVNEAMCALSGYSEKELLEMTVPDLKQSISADSWAAHWQELRSKSRVMFEANIRAERWDNFSV